MVLKLLNRHKYIVIASAMLSVGLLLSSRAANTKNQFATSYNNEESVLICVSPTAYAYHNHYGQGLNRCTHAFDTITISEAKNQGRTECGYCY